MEGAESELNRGYLLGRDEADSASSSAKCAVRSTLFTSSRQPPQSPRGPVSWECPSEMIFTDELPRDYSPQDLVGALADRHQRRVPIEPLDLVLGRVAVTAVDAHRI